MGYLVAIISLAGLYTRPTFPIQAPSISGIIKTSNSEPISIESQEIFEGFEDYQNRVSEFNIQDLVVTGDGLEAWELENLERSFQFEPGAKPLNGPVDFLISQLEVNSSGTLSLRVLSQNNLTVSLMGSGIDTVAERLTAGSSSMEFQVIPKLAGRFSWQIVGVANTDTIFSEIIPVVVQPFSVKKVLMLTQAPSFEYRFLKNHLAASGFGIAERIQISKDFFREAFTNMEKISLENLSLETLDGFKLLVIDGTTFKGLSRNQRNRINETIKTGRMGVLLIGGDIIPEWADIEKSEQFSLSFTGESGELSLESNQVEIKNSTTTKIQEQKISSTVRLGIGRITIPHLINTYALILQGEEALYAKIWERLLRSTLGSVWGSDKVEVAAFTRLNEPTLISIRAESLPADLKVGDARLSVSQEWPQKGKWEAKFWPSERGWNTLSWNNQEELVFVFDSSEWQTQKRFDKISRNREWAEKELSAPISINQVNQPISKWLFFLGFVISFGFLWLEQRLS